MWLNNTTQQLYLLVQVLVMKLLLDEQVPVLLDEHECADHLTKHPSRLLSLLIHIDVERHVSEDHQLKHMVLRILEEYLEVFLLLTHVTRGMSFFSGLGIIA